MKNIKIQLSDSHTMLSLTQLKMFGLLQALYALQPARPLSIPFVTKEAFESCLKLCQICNYKIIQIKVKSSNLSQVFNKEIMNWLQPYIKEGPAKSQIIDCIELLQFGLGETVLAALLLSQIYFQSEQEFERRVNQSGEKGKFSLKEVVDLRQQYPFLIS